MSPAGVLSPTLGLPDTISPRSAASTDVQALEMTEDGAVLSACVFDEVVYTQTYTGDKLAGLLASRNKLTILAVVDDADTAGTVSVQIEHSGDGRTWNEKNTTAEIDSYSIGTGAKTMVAGSDNGSSGLLCFVRLRVKLVTTTRAHVRLYMCGRDG